MQHPVLAEQTLVFYLHVTHRLLPCPELRRIHDVATHSHFAHSHTVNQRLAIRYLEVSTHDCLSAVNFEAHSSKFLCSDTMTAHVVPDDCPPESGSCGRLWACVRDFCVYFLRQQGLVHQGELRCEDGVGGQGVTQSCVGSTGGRSCVQGDGGLFDKQTKVLLVPACLENSLLSCELD